MTGCAGGGWNFRSAPTHGHSADAGRVRRSRSKMNSTRGAFGRSAIMSRPTASGDAHSGEAPSQDVHRQDRTRLGLFSATTSAQRAGRNPRTRWHTSPRKHLGFMSRSGGRFLSPLRLRCTSGGGSGGPGVEWCPRHRCLWCRAINTLTFWGRTYFLTVLAHITILSARRTHLVFSGTES